MITHTSKDDDTSTEFVIMSAKMSAESSRHRNAKNQSTLYVGDGQTIIGLMTSMGFPSELFRNQLVVLRLQRCRHVEGY